MIKGLKQGLAILLVLGTAVFGFTVSGTVKTWVSGDTLTATDLNTTVQSLKTAVENATQVGSAQFLSNNAAVTYRSGFLSHNSYSVGAESQYQWPAVRAGVVKSARVQVSGANGCTGNTVVTLRKNGVDTAISMTIPAGSVAQVTDADTVSFVQGDLLNWVSSCPTVSSFGPSGTITFEF